MANHLAAGAIPMTQRTTQDWHQRYLQQASWTQDLRRYLFAQVGMEKAARVIEIGCGTGAILSDILDSNPSGVYGLDISAENLHLASETSSGCHLTHGDALNLPFESGTFDLVLCHYFLLWVSYPGRGLAEMRRITRPGGYVIALAEPDYGGRIDFPSPLDELGILQTRSLTNQGADVHMGRKLSGLFSSAGLVEIQAGVLGNYWSEPPGEQDRKLEWDVLVDDILEYKPGMDLTDYLLVEQSSWDHGNRVLFVPTFYAWGKVP
ncbi:MAG TPA: methyltransferase domain-containing protein [Anaerolineaceae bacterium]|nr:methyltransferase domain-containing protein [Longilinea sp.]NMD30240.1 methyltransferase domain-containing protein [Chloroflexota bacterium]HNY99933.1 methyltransferase domain-containing protein [Anaerolineaceae bacterium]HOD44589.1 methyltransferase domain-containing protein [Anaerolineaceae bacterium]HOH18862.1 methyltransferase domain-containing protein [Anaerolineaceae bacterium]